MTEYVKELKTNSQEERTDKEPRRISTIKYPVVKLQSLKNKYVLTDWRRRRREKQRKQE